MRPMIVVPYSIYRKLREAGPQRLSQTTLDAIAADRANPSGSYVNANGFLVT